MYLIREINSGLLVQEVNESGVPILAILDNDDITCLRDTFKITKMLCNVLNYLSSRLDWNQTFEVIEVQASTKPLFPEQRVDYSI